MNVAIATHFYLPEPCAAATRVASLADALANAGHDVTVVTNFPSFPSGTFARGDRFTLARSTRTGRTRVVRLFSVLAKGLPGFRLLHWLSSALAATCFFLFTREHFDVVIVSMPPITLAAPAFAGARRHRARLVLDVRDVFPDIAIAMGAWRRDGSMARACEWVARRLYRRADLIVAVTPTALAHIASRGVDASRLVLARNAAELAPALAGERFPNTRFTAIYAGNLGVATDLDVLVDAAVLLADDAITIEIVGDGARRAYLEERIRNENVGNIVVEGSLPRAEAMRRVASADVSIIPLRKGIEESVPTKLYDSLSLGCPVVVAAEGEAQKEGTALGAMCTPPGDADALAHILRQLSVLEKPVLRSLGAQGKIRVEARADRANIMADLAIRISGLPEALETRVRSKVIK